MVILRSRAPSLAVFLTILLACFAAASSPSVQAEQAQAPPPTTDAKKQAPQPVTIHIEVTAGDNNKPVDSASVYVRYPLSHKMKSDTLAEMNVKTTPEGKVRVTLVPKGKILIQVIAPGWKTFGKWFDLTDDDQVFKIHLDRPPKWY